MLKQDVLDSLTRCLEKSKLDDCYTITSDQDEIATFSIDQEGFLCFEETVTAYHVDDITAIKYAKSTEFEPAYIAIRFQDQSVFHLLEDGMCRFFAYTPQGDDRVSFDGWSIATRHMYLMGQVRKQQKEEDTLIVIDNSVVRYQGQDTKVIIPEGVINIEDHAFSQAYNVEEVVLPHSLRTIKENAFLNCSNLKEIVFPQQLSKIMRFAFGRCSSLTHVQIPQYVVSIGPWAFCGCSSLQDVVISSEKTKIEPNAFDIVLP